MRDIRTYLEYINNSTGYKIVPSEYFVESTYIDITGRTLPCYLITKKGCDLIANKLTGQKGIIFTIKYVDKFNEMERELNPQLKVPQTFKEALLLAVEQQEQIEQISKEKDSLEIQLDQSKEWYSIKRVAHKNGVNWRTFKWNLLKNKSIELSYEVKKIFDANYGEVNAYHEDLWIKVYPEYEL